MILADERLEGPDGRYEGAGELLLLEFERMFTPPFGVATHRSPERSPQMRENAVVAQALRVGLVVLEMARLASRASVE